MTQRLSKKPQVSIGDRYGKWIVLSKADNPGYWNVRCDCGTERSVKASSLISKRSKSCGCAYRSRTYVSFTDNVDDIRRESLTILGQVVDRCQSFLAIAKAINETGVATRAEAADCRRESSMLSRALVDWRNSCIESNNPGSMARRVERRERYERNQRASQLMDECVPNDRDDFYNALMRRYIKE